MRQMKMQFDTVGHIGTIPDTVYKTVDMDEARRKWKNGSQNKQILELFLEWPVRKFTAWQVNRMLGWKPQRITSTRRAMTTLSKHPYGYIKKLDETRMETEGEKNHLYQLSQNL